MFLGSFSEVGFVMEDFQESLSTSSSLSLSSLSSSSPIAHPSSPSSALSLSTGCFSSPDPLSIDAELWLMAEQRIQEILCIIRPAVASEERRKSIIRFFQRLIKDYYDIEVFPFGSVPLKTFLPDGDIDLTALSPPNLEEEVASYICSIFKNEQQDSEFVLQDVQYIQAQVKIVKCTVDDIQVDISFNQIAGLSTLCFLEQVDQLVGKDHLFKRSIILIKAWCYYESRILGAHHGLISTYALEILILYIINVFHSSLCDPLAVLYKFLDYYSTFDWEHFCISINGPVFKSLLPEVVPLTPEYNGDEVLLSQDFLRDCREKFSVPMQAFEIGTNAFPIKHMNIMDPLKVNNNLGRSVSKGNFFRIRSAFSYGAQRIGEILTLPGELMGIKLEQFFVNTINRNGRGERLDARIPVPAFGCGRSEVSELSGDDEVYCKSLLSSQGHHDNALPLHAQPTTVPSYSQKQKKTAWDTLCQFMSRKRYSFYQKSTNMFIPRLSFSHTCAPPLPAATYGFEKMTKSRGTGTYIPEMIYQSYDDMQSWESISSHESSDSSPLQSSPQTSDPFENPLKTDNRENGNCLDLNLSLEHYPFLSGNKRTMTTHQPSQLSLKSPQAEKYPRSLSSIKFGLFDCSYPIRMHSPSAEQADSTLCMPTIEEKRKESCKFNAERDVVTPFRLKDNDFPPL